MDLERAAGGRMHFVLGTVERWVVAAGATTLVALIGVVYVGIAAKIDEGNQNTRALTATVSQVVTQQAVTNGQVATLTQQLSDVPRLKTDVAETKVRVDRLEQDTKELRQLQGLKR
ncbi:MAG: hypothetical protein GX856_03780 [Gammaproteobacteria bacterium]|jgi:ubiquinone biosynthesis protein UbiJ|nr:hypothetical protein [Gammaproteobacteria bacterium]